MIVTDLGDRWRLITQPDHARFSGELLRLWRGPELAHHPRRDAILFAAREHDNGWREADAAPRWAAGAGRPHDFVSIPEDLRMEIWLRGTARFAESHPYAALLTTLHGLSFSERREEEGGEAEAPPPTDRDAIRAAGRTTNERWNAFVDRLEERRDDLLEATGVPLEVARGDYRWIAWSDTASLAVCDAWTVGFEKEVPAGTTAGASLRTVRGRYLPDEARLLLDPLPLAGATRFRIPCREVAKRDYAGDADFATALATARWGEMEVRVSGGDPSGGD